jgi:hypothetical protein
LSACRERLRQELFDQNLAHKVAATRAICSFVDLWGLMATCDQEAFAALERKLIEEKARLQKEAESQVKLPQGASIPHAMCRR